MSKRPPLRWLVVRLPVDPDFSGPVTARPIRPVAMVMLIAAGGIVGSLARAGISEVLRGSPGRFPWSTLVVNVLGAGALAVLLVLLTERYPVDRVVRPLIGTGLIGGFTTFSTFTVDVVQLSATGHSGLAGLYVLLTMTATATATLVGLFGARALSRLMDTDHWSRRVHRALAEQREEVDS